MNIIVSQFIANVLITASLYLLIGLSFYLVFYVTRIFHVFNAALITVGAYFTYLLVTMYRLPLILGVILSLLITVLIGIIGERAVFIPLHKKKRPTLDFLIASIGMYIILENLISMYFGSNTKVLNPGKGQAGHPLFGAYVTTVQLATVGTAVLIFAAIYFFLNYSFHGRALRAVASNPGLSNIYGISARKVTTLAMGLSALLAAIAGILMAMDTGITPVFGFNVLIYGVAAMMIGGLGNSIGLAVGTILLSLSQHSVSYYFGTSWSDPVGYIVLILFLLWKPLGLSGHKIKKVEI